MTWTLIRLDLARTRDFPEGSPAHGYLLRLPLRDDGTVDEAAFRADHSRAYVKRRWPGEPAGLGAVVRKRGGWAFSYAPGDEDDEGIFHLENHPLRPGEYLTVTEADGEKLPFRVVSCTPEPTAQASLSA